MKKIVKVGKFNIGDGNITIQSMTNLPVTDVEATCEQIKRLCGCGCDIVRIAVPNKESVVAFRKVRDNFKNVPLVADIHFDYRLAIGAIEAGADKIRINPGNISKDHLIDVVDCAKKNNVAIRLGVNGGSVNKDALKLYKNKCVALYKNLEEYVQYFEDNNFDNIVLSIKSSDVAETIETNRLISKLGYPIHLGVTEAGLPEMGIVKNAIGIGSLLCDGIGDTIRVSLTADPVEEVFAAKRILSALNIGSLAQFVSCPKCGRCSVNLEKVAQEVYDYVKNIPCKIKVAVMGCEVNGPGECKDADIGIAGSNGDFVLFTKGELFKKIDSEHAVDILKKEIDKLVEKNI